MSIEDNVNDISFHQHSGSAADRVRTSMNSLIMMVDDEPILMDLVQAYLEEWGYKQFVMCEDSSKAMDIITSKHPDVLLLDLVMPGVSGFDILRSLRRNEVTRFLPVIVLTSSTDSDTKLKALELGATDFLAKPVDSSELALRLRNTLTVKAHQDRLADYDQLTELPNRRVFQERIEWAMRRKNLYQEKHELFLVGLDRFKQINETLGPQVGDRILRDVASRLYQFVVDNKIEQALVARIGGDEFGILFHNSGTVASMTLASKILQQIDQPFHIDGGEVFVNASIGIASTNDVKKPLELIPKASVAEKHAKKVYKSSYQLYSSSIDAEAAELFRIETELRRALDFNEFELFYQPKMDAKSRTPVGMEALIRWRPGGGAFVPPDKFIPIAESTGLIVAIGEWVLRQACLQTKVLEVQGVETKVSVNVSAYQVSDRNLIPVISQALKDSGLAPDKLVIEITESSMMGDLDKTLRVLNNIRNLGVSLSIDDFGTGYSSLSYLKRFPISELKIDQSFLREFPGNEEDTAIIHAILALAHALGLSVTAEGVEHAEQADYLTERDCELLQGYHFSKPLAFKDYCDFAMGFSEKTRKQS